MGHSAPITLFLFPLWANVPLPSTSPKNKCFGEAPLPCGAGRRFLLPTVAEILCGRGDFAAIRGAKKYPTLLITCLPKNPPLYIRSGRKFWQRLEINISITNLIVIGGNIRPL